MVFQFLPLLRSLGMNEDVPMHLHTQKKKERRLISRDVLEESGIRPAIFVNLSTKYYSQWYSIGRLACVSYKAILSQRSHAPPAGHHNNAQSQCTPTSDERNILLEGDLLSAMQLSFQSFRPELQVSGSVWQNETRSCFGNKTEIGVLSCRDYSFE